MLMKLEKKGQKRFNQTKIKKLKKKIKKGINNMSTLKPLNQTPYLTWI